MIPDEAVIAGAAAIQVRLDKNIGLNDLARAVLEAALPYLASAARQPQRTSPTDWPDVPRLP